jgi:hypothetical protein
MRKVDPDTVIVLAAKEELVKDNPICVQKIIRFLKEDR